MFSVSSSILRLVARFLRQKAGNIAITTAIAAPAVFGSAGLAFDYYTLAQQRVKLQATADAAALAATKELTVSLTGSDYAIEIAKQYASSLFTGIDPNGHLETNAKYLEKDRGIKVNLAYTWQPFFAQYFNTSVTPIKVTATAKLAGNALTCVIGLMQPQVMAKSAIHLDNRSVLQADGCSVYSNSEHRYSMRADDNAKMVAQSICAAGGIFQTGQADFEPEPMLDCPKITNPLVGRANPDHTGCDFRDAVVTADSTLRPGIYCGGLKISGNARIKLDPGIYVIKDGPFLVEESTQISGTGVGFFLTGVGSVFEFQQDTTIDLSAPETGPMAGLLFFEDLDVPHSFNFNPFFLKFMPSSVRLHKISSNNARNLLGTIYLARSILLVNANAPVADTSAYTAIVVGRLWLQEGPTLTLNADYSETSVPVPGGLMGTQPVLTE